MTVVRGTILSAFVVLTLSNGLGSATASTAAASTVVSECSSRLPMSLSTVVSDLDAEGIEKVTTASFLTSRGVTPSRRATILGIDDPSTTSFGTSTGICLAIAQTTSISEVVSTALSCDGNIIYYPDEDDLARGEGIFDSLGPAMERIMNADNSDSGSRVLIVVSANPSKTKKILESAASDVLSNLVMSSSTSKKIAALDQLFGEVQYVSSFDEAMQKLVSDEDPEAVQERIATTVASDFLQTGPVSLSSSMASRDLAASRTLGPVARKVFANAVETVKSVSDNQLVKEFKSLCKAATDGALQTVRESATPEIVSSPVGKQICEDLKNELTGEFADLAATQMAYLEEACFAEFQQRLSKLTLTPNLPKTMQDTATESLSEFTKASKGISADTSDIKTSLQKRMLDFCSQRMMAARASGKFTPLPKKGVQIGLHWLLPKPFGNDYRQEPWLVQATDNMVYVPPDKITDVNPTEVASGDWRSSVVPAPAGNEIVYMQ